MQANISWNAVTQYTDGSAISGTVKYNVYRASQSNLSDAVHLNGDLTVLNYVDSTIVAGATYYYFVRAFTVASNPSANSNVASVATFPPNAPTGVIVVVT